MGTEDMFRAGYAAIQNEAYHKADFSALTHHV